VCRDAYTAQLRETQRLKKAAHEPDDPDDLHDPLGTVDVEGSTEFGVHCSVRQIEEVAIDSGFFDEL